VKKLVLLVAVAVVVAGGFYFFKRSAEASGMAFRTAPVKLGNLLVTISATGTVEPEEVVDVGSQVAGKIASFGEDPKRDGAPIDYGSEVEVGTVLARIDDALYTADVALNDAQVEQAKANVTRAQADLQSKVAAQAQAEAGVELARVTYNHLQEIPIESQSSIEMRTADATLKQARAALETAKANVGVSRAMVTQAEKAVLQAAASLQRSKTNLDYCTIRSPVKGVIIDRRVNIGQTVVASLNAPSLFLIAKDLKRIQVWVSVNEADIGHIHPGQSVTFTVDAFAGQVFHGQVGKVRLNATMTQNVVMYTVEVSTDNADGKLLPYLTANIQIITGHRQNVLVVPNAALLWEPRANQIAPESRQTSRTTGGDPAEPQGTIWVAKGSFVRPVKVDTGLTDGAQTEVAGPDVSAGMSVVVGDQSASSTGEAGGGPSPFTPQLHRAFSQPAPGSKPAGGGQGHAP